MAYFTKYIFFYNLDENNTLLLNTLTSAVDIVNNLTLVKIQKMIDEKKLISSKDDPELFSILKKRGYIFENSKEERKIIETLRQINKRSLTDVINTTFTICPTMGCNLRCTYCFEDNEQHNNFKLLSEAQLNVIFGHIKKCCDRLKKKEELTKGLPSTRISLFGGEPLLQPNYSIIKKIFNFAKEMQIPVNIVTNGTTIDDKYYKLLKEYKSNISVIQVTIDGNKSIHDIRRIRADGSGTFDSICNGIDKFLEIGLKINLRINIDAENIMYISDVKEVFDSRGWTTNPLFLPYASPVKCYNHSQKAKTVLADSEMLDILMENGWYGNKNAFFDTLLSPVFGVVTRFFNTPDNQIKPWKKTYCEGTLGAQYCFTPDGNISTCLTCVGNSFYRVGTFDEKGVKIDENRLQMWTKRDPFEMEKCKKCKFVFFCGGGCPVEALENNEDINCPVCDDIEKTLEVYIKHIKDKLLLKKESNDRKAVVLSKA